MEWRNEAAADLPEPRRDDPPALRGDILDELADHLACAADRERLRGGDEADIAGRVRQRFGDPARVARQLWLDAIKEKLMAQRITTVVAVILALAAVLACGVLWSSVRQTRELLVDAIAQGHARTDKTNAALLARIEELTRSNEQMSSFGMEWNPVRLHLVKGADGSEPAAGYTAALEGHPYKGGDHSTILKTADGSGLADLGRVQPGAYELTVSTPWSAYNKSSLQVAPGESVEKTILCPDKEIVETDVRMEVVWPQLLPDTIDAVAVRMYGPTLEFGAEERWWLRGAANRYLLLHRDGGLRVLDEDAFSNLSDRNASRRQGILGGVHLDFAKPDDPRLNWRTAKYTIHDIHLVSLESLIPYKGSPADAELYWAAAGFRGHHPQRLGLKPAIVVSSAESGAEADSGRVKLPTPLVYVADAQRPVVWQIELPDALVEDARKRLSQFETWREEWREQEEARVRPGE